MKAKEDTQGTCPKCRVKFARCKSFNKASTELCGKCLAQTRVPLLNTNSSTAPKTT